MNNPDLYSAPVVDVPRKVINLQPVNSIVGIQIQKLQVAAVPPAVQPHPVNVQRVLLPNGQYKYAVQFMVAPIPGYQSTTVSTNSAGGSGVQQANIPLGPATFIAPKSSTPASVVTQVQTASGSQQPNALGVGQSRVLVQS